MFVEFKGVRATYSLNIESKYTILDDLSVTGKTTMLNDIKTIQGSPAFSIKSTIPVRVVNTLYELLDSPEVSIVFMDEDAETLHAFLKDTLNLMLTDSRYYILVSRENNFAEIPYSVDDIKVLQTVHGVSKFKNKYPRLLRDGVVVDKDSKCVVEDSTIGYTFFKTLFDNCITSRGKDGLIKRCLYGDSDVIVFDRCGFGSSASAFYKSIDIYSKVVIDYESFEWMLLKYLKQPIIPPINTSNREAWYFEQLHQVLPQYGKTASCHCLSSCRCNTCIGKFVFYNKTTVLEKTLEVRVC